MLFTALNAHAVKHIGETKRNFIVRKREHENVKHNSEPARHLATQPKRGYK